MIAIKKSRFYWGRENGLIRPPPLTQVRRKHKMGKFISVESKNESERLLMIISKKCDLVGMKVVRRDFLQYTDMETHLTLKD